MAGVAEPNRQRISFILIGIGLGLILLGFGLLIYNQTAMEVPVATRPSAVPASVKARVLKQMLFWLVVLILLFAVSTMAFLRWSRHFRRSLLRKPRPPTPSDDVWAMHKLPEGALEEWTEPEKGTDRPET